MIDQIYKNKVRFEGEILYPYLDTVGVPTVGVGINIGTNSIALSVNWQPCPLHGRRYTDDDIQSQLRQLHFREHHRAEFYETATTLRITRDESRRLLRSHVDNSREELNRLFPLFDVAPIPAKLALFDMIFNLGVTRLRVKFPKFCAAVRREHWRTAALESSRSQVSESRNRYVKDCFMQICE